MSTTGAIPLLMDTVDEVTPRSRGGLANRDNQVLACKGCNQGKGNRMPTPDELRRLAALVLQLPPVTLSARAREMIEELDEMEE